MVSFPHVANRLFDEPLMVHPGKAVAILRALGPRIVGGPMVIDGVPALDHIAGAEPAMGRLGDPLGQWYSDRESFFRVGPVAVIPVEGTLVNKGKWVGAYSGETSYEGLHRQIQAAHDPSVHGVVLEVDSCGGEVAGVFDLAEAVHELALSKPTIAILTDVAYSAAYLIASATGGIVVPSTGGAGSIGVITLHADFSGALEQEGIRVTVLSAGAHKAEGNPYQALSESVAAKWQAEIEAVRGEFAAAVGRYRGNRLTAEAALATEAACLRGPDAVAAGLADEVERPSKAFAAFVAEIEGRPA
jgi:ClpP class serine protease